MADTIRTRAALLALLADNTTGEISAQDLRDMLVSIFGVYGVIKCIDRSTPQTVADGVAEKLENFCTNGLAVGMTPDKDNNQITVDKTGVYVLCFAASIESNVVNTTIYAHFAIDAGIEDGGFHQKIAPGGDVGSGACFDIVLINAAEVLSILIEADNDCTITMTDGQLVAVRIG